MVQVPSLTPVMWQVIGPGIETEGAAFGVRRAWASASPLRGLDVEGHDQLLAGGGGGASLGARYLAIAWNTASLEFA